MYTPVSNVVVNAAMRWPAFGLAAAMVIGYMSEDPVGRGIAWVASVALGTLTAARSFSDHFCDCEEAALKVRPKVDWVIECNPESGSKRPWEIYSMFGGLESTKQHYASYSTEEHALARKKELEENT